MPAGEILAADFVATMAGPMLRGGAIAFAQGRILEVGKSREIKTRFPDFIFSDLGDSIILPGLINAHTHLELSDCVCNKKPPGRFTDWILALPQRGRMDEASIEQSVRDSVNRGAKQCLRFGVTCVGDISQYPRYSRSVLADLPLRAVSYAEALGSGARRWRFEKLLRDAEAAESPSDRIMPGISPHAPYSVDLAGYRECLSLSRRRQLPLATHLAEWPEETEFLIHHQGMFREFLDLIRSWEENIETFPAPPIRFAHAIGLLAEPALLAHVNYCDDDELSLLSSGRASVVYCPRTHHYFGHPPHRWREMLAAGINLAIGTDSCASSPDLNLVEEIRLLRQIAPDFPPEDLWRLITVNAARALRRSDAGLLQAGNAADFVAFPAASENPLTDLLENSALPRCTWIAGTKVA